MQSTMKVHACHPWGPVVGIEASTCGLTAHGRCIVRINRPTFGGQFIIHVDTMPSASHGLKMT